MATKTRSGLSPAKIRFFLAILIRNQTVFERFQLSLKPVHFPEEHQQLVFLLVQQHQQEFNTLPAFAELEVALTSELEANPDLLAVADQDELQDFLAYAFDPDTFSDKDPAHEDFVKGAVKAGKLLLLDHQRKKLEQAVTSPETKLSDLPLIVETARSQTELITLMAQNEDITLTFRPNWERTASRRVRSTGLGFLDKYLGGGAAVNEAYGVMAPYGTCKTTLAVMLWSLSAQQAYAEELAAAELTPGPPARRGLAVFVSYEAPLQPEILQRTVIYTAQVRRDRLDSMVDLGLDALSADAENPIDYEKPLFREQIRDGVFSPERNRVESIVPLFNQHTLCLDFSGAQVDEPLAGTGGVREIGQRIRQELRRRKQKTGIEHYVTTIIIDYVGLMVDRDSSKGGGSGGRPEDHKLYQSAGQEIGKLIREHNCHAWAFHQLSGEANAKQSPTAKIHHTDAKGSRSFAENLDFVFCFGNLNLDSMGQLACTKHRFFKQLPPTIVHVQGEFNCVQAPDNFFVDPQGRIVDKSTMSATGNYAGQSDGPTAEVSGDYVSDFPAGNLNFGEVAEDDGSGIQFIDAEN